jgi:MoxR-like ATPase
MDDVAMFESLGAAREELVGAIGQVVVGQRRVVELMLTALVSDGHCLFVGVPGLAKTLLVNTVAEAIGVRFGRIQFTPDLMPSDITGTEVLDSIGRDEWKGSDAVFQALDVNHDGKVTPDEISAGLGAPDARRTLRFVPGPVFTNLLLADEINRTPPKTQAALLQAMQERAVTAAGRTYRLERPFLVFATQNPIEQEGTYPLPEAQQDRFMFSIPVGYPSIAEEEEVVRRTTVGDARHASRVLDAARLIQYQDLLRRLPSNPDVVSYCVRLAAATRPGSGAAATKWIRWGAGPRASQFMAIGARSWAALHGNEVPSRDDVREVAAAVLRHRIVLNFEAEAAGLDPDSVVKQLVDEVG